MALDINEQVANAYEAAKRALNDDLKQNLYNATQARVQAFRQLNNNANANHALYSGAPAGAQMQYDQNTYIPNIGTLATRALAKQEENQEKWDKYMEYVGELQDQANYYNQKANELAQKKAAIPSLGGSTSGGYSSKPDWSSFGGGSSTAEENFANSSSESGGNGKGYSGGGGGGGGGGGR